MELQFVFHLLVLTTSVELRSIEVYEDVDDTPYLSFNNNFELIQPNTNQRLYFSGVAQTDKLKWRYFQQQQMDARNRARNKNLLRKGKVRNRNVSNIRKREVYPATENHPQAAEVVFIPTIRPKIINFGFDHNLNVKLLDENYAERPQHDSEVQALNELVGKQPAAQLEGLKQLLGPRDHTPITEDYVDFANPQKRPNIKVEPAPLEYQAAVAQEHVLRAETQKRLKQIATRAQAHEIMSQAHQAALAEVIAKSQSGKGSHLFRLPTPLVHQEDEGFSSLDGLKENEDDKDVSGSPEGVVQPPVKKIRKPKHYRKVYHRYSDEEFDDSSTFETFFDAVYGLAKLLLPTL